MFTLQLPIARTGGKPNLYLSNLERSNAVSGAKVSALLRGTPEAPQLLSP